MNWIAELARPGAPPREDWNRRVDKSVFLEHFRGWKFDWLDVPAMIEATDVTYEFPKIDRNPVDRWTYGRVTLAGDAAHPMHPVGSQAGSPAIVDGRVLAYHLATARSAAGAAALSGRAAAGDARHHARQSHARAGNRHASCRRRAPGGFSNLDEILPPAELAARAAEFKEKAGFAVEALNRRASYSVH
jgi:2-polyprenyl-6-methoxyphenol hydroxylase-like FAD-dependent oxidoreductase